MPQSKYVWYCCQCSYGPLSWEVDAGCPNCLNLRCSNCEIVGRGPSRVAQAGNSINPSQEASRYSVADTNKPVGLEDSWAASRESAQFRAPHLGDVKTIKDGDGSSSTAPAESAQVQNPEDPAAVDESMQFLEDLDINYLDDFFAERDVASQIARALLSDVGLRQSITHGFEENAEHFPEQLIICTRFLAIELQDYATQEHEQRAAVFIAKHALTIVRKIKSELGMTDPGGYAMLDDDEAFPLHGEYLNIVLSGGPFFWNSSQNNIVLQSNLEAVQLFILQPPSPHNFIVRLQKYLDDPHHNETLMPVNQQDKISMRSLFVETFPRIKRVMEPKPQPGTIRIRWTCSCGTMVWDDYPQRPACEANLLQLRLNRLFRTATNDNSTTQHTNTAFHPWRTPRTLMINLRVLLGGLYRENEQQRDPENTTPSPPHHLEEDAGVYLLTCVGTGRGLSSLFQEKWNSVKNDRTYFQMLRTLNSTSTSGWRNFFKFQTITAIEYVRVRPSLIESMIPAL